MDGLFQKLRTLFLDAILLLDSTRCRKQTYMYLQDGHLSRMQFSSGSLNAVLLRLLRSIQTFI